MKVFSLTRGVRNPLIQTLAVVFGFAVALPAWASDDTIYDPIEDVNRYVFEFNNTLDNAVLEPIAEAYVEHVHQDIRDVVRNALRHLKSPVIFANSLLQGNLARAENTLYRFAMNTVVGFGGLKDPASKNGLPYHEEDFGQTLGVWGVPEGPYIVLPILGPTNLRDGVGAVADSFISPLSYIDGVAFEWSHRAIYGVDTRAGLLDTLEDLERTSLDYYAAVRSLYKQRRVDEIGNGEKGDSPVPVPNISMVPVNQSPSLALHLSPITIE